MLNKAGGGGKAAPREDRYFLVLIKPRSWTNGKGEKRGQWPGLAGTTSRTRGPEGTGVLLQDRTEAKI